MTGEPATRVRPRAKAAAATALFVHVDNELDCALPHVPVGVLHALQKQRHHRLDREPLPAAALRDAELGEDLREQLQARQEGLPLAWVLGRLDEVWNLPSGRNR